MADEEQTETAATARELAEARMRLDAQEREIAELRRAVAELVRAAGEARAGDDSLGGGPEPAPASAWTEPTAFTANPDPAPRGDADFPAAAQLPAGFPSVLRSVATERTRVKCPGELELWHFQQTSVDAVYGLDLLEQGSSASGESTLSLAVTPPALGTGKVVRVAAKVCDTVTGDTELVWIDLASGGTLVRIPDPSAYSDIHLWYQALQDLIQEGPPQGYTDPIIVIDWDPTFGDWKYLDLANLDYWPRGEDETKCYGSAIGDSGQNKVIDLDNLSLEGSWGVTGDFNASSGLVQAGTLEVVAAYVDLNGDRYVPTNITVGTDTYTVLAKV